MRAALALAALIAAPAAAQERVCAPTADMVGWLLRDYGETPTVLMLRPSDAPVMVTVNRETQTWSMLVQAGDTSCLVAAGTGFAVIEPETPAKGEPA